MFVPLLSYKCVAGSNYGTFAPKNFRSREQKYHGMELSLPGTSFPWNFRSLELSLPGTFAPGSESSKNFRSPEPSLPGTFALGSKIPRTFAPTPSDFRSRHSFMDMIVCIRGCVRVLSFVVQRPIHIRRCPHNHHFQHTTLVGLTTS